jgi:hypothetical protein
LFSASCGVNSPLPLNLSRLTQQQQQSARVLICLEQQTAGETLM